MRKDPKPKVVYIVIVRVTEKEAQIHRERERRDTLFVAAMNSSSDNKPRFIEQVDYPNGSFLERWYNWTYFELSKKDVAIVRLTSAKDYKACTDLCLQLQLEFMTTQFREDHRTQARAVQRLRQLSRALSGWTAAA